MPSGVQHSVCEASEEDAEGAAALTDSNGAAADHREADLDATDNEIVERRGDGVVDVHCGLARPYHHVVKCVVHTGLLPNNIPAWVKPSKTVR